MISTFLSGVRRRMHDVGVVRQVLERAEQLAREDGVEQPGAEHLVLAACELPDGTARAALASVDTTPDALAAAISDVHDEALGAIGVQVAEPAVDDALPEPPAPRGAYHSQVPLQEVFGRARELVDQEDSRLSGAWFLVAAAERRRGTVARALRHAGVDPDELAVGAREAARRYAADA